MYFLSILLFLPVIDAFIITKIHRNSIYRSHSPSSCVFIGNRTLPNGGSIQSCIWECAHQYNCQTAVYFNNGNTCSIFAESCEKGYIESSGTVLASVICYRQNHELTVTCSSTSITNQEKTSQSDLVTSTKQDTPTSTKTTPLSTLTSFWSFDNNTLDGFSVFDGIAVGSPTYISPGINGYGCALSVNQTNRQFVNVSTYRNLSYRSFTVEMWFYGTGLTSGSYGLFGQNQYPNTSHSLHCVIINFKLRLGFYSDDVDSSTAFQTDTWYHVAFVYDNSSLIQRVHLNGKLDGYRASSPYEGTSGSILIGAIAFDPGSPQCFSGYIDEVLLTMRAKNASEILDDATLVCWHSFDNGSLYDSGPLRLHGIAGNITFVDGRVNQAVNFTSNSSYYQIGGFVLLGVENYSYSIAFWVRPSSINESVLLHLSTITNGQSWCLDFMSLSHLGQIILTIGNNSLQSIVGPVLSVHVWTHIANTYSTAYGFQLYVNGTLNGTTGSRTRPAFGKVNTLTLGNPFSVGGGSPCMIPPIAAGSFHGAMDEFRVYSRELNITDIQTLANP